MPHGDDVIELCFFEASDNASQSLSGVSSLSFSSSRSMTSTASTLSSTPRVGMKKTFVHIDLEQCDRQTSVPPRERMRIEDLALALESGEDSPKRAHDWEDLSPRSPFSGKTVVLETPTTLFLRPVPQDRFACEAPMPVMNFTQPPMNFAQLPPLNFTQVPAMNVPQVPTLNLTQVPMLDVTAGGRASCAGLPATMNVPQVPTLNLTQVPM